MQLLFWRLVLFVPVLSGCVVSLLLILMIWLPHRHNVRLNTFYGLGEWATDSVEWLTSFFVKPC